MNVLFLKTNPAFETVASSAVIFKTYVVVAVDELSPAVPSNIFSDISAFPPFTRIF